MSFERKLEQLKSRHQELADMMASGTLDGEEFSKVSIEYADLDPVVEAVRGYESAVSEKADLEEMLEDPDMGKEMRDMAQDELREVSERIPALERAIQLALIPKDKADEKNAIWLASNMSHLKNFVEEYNKFDYKTAQK